MGFLNRLLAKLMGYGNISVDIHFDKNHSAWAQFLKEYNPKIQDIRLSTEKEAFDTAVVEIAGIRVSAISPYYPNPEFDKEEYIKRCAIQRETWRILELYKNEIDIEGRIKQIKDHKDPACMG